jgi:glycosyltransferase involved in cell wall biosynthesis
MFENLIGISFIVMTRNNELDIFDTFKSIESALDSANNKNYQIVFVNNNSQDKTASIIDQIVAGSHNFDIANVFEQKIGISYAISAGLKKVTREMVVPIPGHNLWSKESITRLVNNSIDDRTIVMCTRANKLGNRPILKYLTSQIFIKITNRLFQTNYDDINGLIAFPTIFLKNVFQPDLGHAHALVPLLMATNQKFPIKVIQGEVNYRHSSREGQKLKDYFPKFSHVFSVIKALVRMKKLK